MVYLIDLFLNLMQQDLRVVKLTFKEYEFNMEDLPPFKYYRVKFVLTSTNQTYVPRVSNLRVITLA